MFSICMYFQEETKVRKMLTSSEKVVFCGESQKVEPVFQVIPFEEIW